MTTTAKTAPILREAAVIYQRNGRYDGDYYDNVQYYGGTPQDQCAVCAMGAINLAAGTDPHGDDDDRDAVELAALARQALAEHLGWAYDPDDDFGEVADQVIDFLATWHDAGDGSTVERVVAALEAAVAAERGDA